jgi:hypothetical protein
MVDYCLIFCYYNTTDVITIKTTNYSVQREELQLDIRSFFWSLLYICVFRFPGWHSRPGSDEGFLKHTTVASVKSKLDDYRHN